MKTIAFMFFLCCIFVSSQAQVNLVPNPSFEDTVYCSDYGRMAGCKYWVNCRSTPDYDNACHSGTFSVPCNYFGCRVASTGVAYCNLCTFSNVLYREVIGVKLLQSLTPGHNYYVSLKCAPASTASGYCKRTSGMGLRFSTVTYDSLNSAPINNYAHVYSNVIIDDTLDWTTISGNFVADSAYTFLTIGNFFDDEHTDKKGICGIAMYYVDDVEVIDETGEPVPPFVIFQSGNSLAISSTAQNQKVELFDVLGQVCYINTNPEQLLNINTSSFAKAIYVLRIQSTTSYYTTKLIIN